MDESTLRQSMLSPGLLLNWKACTNLLRYQVCKILEIPDAAINNNQPLTPPQLAGAGRVKPFREGDILKHAQDLLQVF